MGKPRHGKPEQPGQAARFSTAREPADAADVMAAIALFVEAYVLQTRRARTLDALLASGEKRAAALEGLPTVVSEELQTTMEGNSGFPAQLQARFGDLRGIVITDPDAYGATIAGAVYAVKHENGFASLFIAHQLALLIPETGRPTLVRRQQVA